MIHPDIQNIFDTKCALAPPSPPRPPYPPPPPSGAFVPSAPSPPPPPPPPAPYFQQRGRDTESGFDPDCEIISYATCKGIVADYAAEHGTANVLRVSFAPCEGLDLDEGCFRGCSFGGANGGLFHDLLPDMLAEFNASNPRRCSLSELPFCACANKPTVYHTFPPPPPITYAENYHAYPAHADGESIVGGAGGVFDAEQGQTSALAKRLTNVHTIDLALRSSHRTLQCPGTNDGEQACARNCAAVSFRLKPLHAAVCLQVAISYAQEHLTALRAFTVTGTVESPSLPPSVPHASPPPAAPLPPFPPFSECQNTCQEVNAGDTKCRDGGLGSWLPTMCPYATQCAACGFRENTVVIVQDNSCAHSNNGVCEDGGFGTETFFSDPLYPTEGLTTSCALGSDETDCASYGPRTAQEIGSEAFQGVTNETTPAPPPPQPQTPPLPPPPPFEFYGNLDTCRALFYPNTNKPGAWLFDCAGTEAEIAAKRDGTWVNLDGVAEKQCATVPPSGSAHRCSDGGFDAIAILWTGDYLSTSASATHFACDYGTSTMDCNPRTQDATTDIHCTRNGNDPSGSCSDSCWVDSLGGVHHEDEQFDTTTAALGGTFTVDQKCHDGGPSSVSNRCGFGTMVSEYPLKLKTCKKTHYNILTPFCACAEHALRLGTHRRVLHTSYVSSARPHGPRRLNHLYHHLYHHHLRPPTRGLQHHLLSQPATTAAQRPWRLHFAALAALAAALALAVPALAATPAAPTTAATAPRI